jgi:pSer/pThr/pTyr-binding forkhead associated (FHA) protein
MAKLILKLKEVTLDEFPIVNSTMTIGRVTGNDIVIDNLAVSRQHARIRQDGADYWIEDLESGNGVLVNDAPIVKALLRDQDEILVGKHTLVFVSEAQAPSGKSANRAVDLAEATVILKPKTQSEPTRRSGNQAAIASEQAGLEGELVILAGGTGQERIPLTQRTTVGGKSATADIRLKGWWVGPRAFMISQKPSGFFITHGDGRRMTRVNGEGVSGQRELQDGDLITIGATKLKFTSKTG